MNFSFVKILMEKEINQILKDKSVLVIAFLLPIMLVVIYGFALRMDIKPVSIAIVTNQNSKIEREITHGFLGSDYFNTFVVSDLQTAKDMFYEHKVLGILYFGENFAKDFANQKGEILFIQNGSQAQLASLSLGYVNSVISGILSKNYANANSNLVTITTRSWFNEANESSWFLVSGQYAGIITLMCVFMGCLLISREWDRGTISSLTNTNATALEIVFSKVVVYFVLALCGSAVTLIWGEILLEIPIRGSIVMLLLTLGLFVLEMICLGVLISSICKNQFLSQEYALIFGFLPTVLLSGLIFDLRGLPMPIYIIGHILPPTYTIESMRICFLSGENEEKLWINLGIELFYASLFFALSVFFVNKDSK